MTDTPQPSPELLDMPEVPMTTIIGYLGPAATVNYAQSCSQVQDFIKTINLNVESISLEISENRCEIRLEFFYSDKKLTWKFLPLDEKIKKRKPTAKVEKSRNPVLFLKKRVEWLTALTRFPVTNVHIVGADFPGSNDLLEWTQIHQIERLSIDLISEMRCSLAPFKDLEHLELVSCEFLKPADLKNLEIANISIFSSNWTSEDLGQVIRDWNSSSNQKLERIAVNLKYNCIAEQILEGLETMRWDPEKRQKDYPAVEPFHPLDCQSARDLERSDGLLASIRIDGLFMDLLIWHKRFEEEPMEIN